MLLDLFPLNSVVFPYQRLVLKIFESRYLKLIDMCHMESRSFGICLIKEGSDIGAPAIPFNIGTSVVIRELHRLSGDLYSIVVQGEKRFRVNSIVNEQPHIMAEIEWIDVEVPCFPGDYSKLRSIIRDIVGDKGTVLDDDNDLIGFIGELLSGYPAEKQKILELSSTEVIPALSSFFESI